MGLELVIFIAAILFGIFLYWRESNGNKVYKFFNKIFNSKELQMNPNNKKGFIYKQAFLPRLVHVVFGFLILGLVIQFLTPFQLFTTYNGISALSSSIVGVLIGTYIANFVLKSSKIIEDKTDEIEDAFQNAVEKGKDIIEDITSNNEEDTVVKEVDLPKKEEKKSARSRLKDKGYLK